MMSRASPAQWLLFGLLALAWGSSFFWIKVGVDEGMKPFTLVALRLGISVATLAVILVATRSRLPRKPGVLARLLLLGLINVALPFTLVTWAEQHVDSALASILNALIPLFVMIFAALVLHDEPLTLNRLGGLLVGFVGAVLLLGRHTGAGPGADASLVLLGELALVGSSILYAASSVYVRRYLSGRNLIDDPVTGPRPLRPTELAISQNAVAFVVMVVAACVFEPAPGGGIAFPDTARAWLALAWLGILGSALAYVVYFRLLVSWGATRTALVTYVMPIVGIGLGVVVLDESLDARMVAGAALIIAGIVLLNARIWQRRLFGRMAGGAGE